MENTSTPFSKAGWTLADFLSTYRYWALFLSSLFMALGAQGFSTVFPMISRTAGSDFQIIEIFYMGSSVGWLVGAFVAFVAAGRRGYPTLLAPLVICTVVAGGFMAAPVLWGSPAFMFAFGLVIGAVRAVFPLAIAIFLVSGQPGKIDFGCALAIMSTTFLASVFAPLGASQLYQLDQSGFFVTIGMLACLVIAILLLAPATYLAFEQPPRPRHQPLAPVYRPPVMVALILIAPPILIALASIAVTMLRAFHVDAERFDLIALVVVAASSILSLAALVYLGYWLYRIHGELAGAEASQRLLTPLAALLIGILAPLGLPILVMTLGDLLNDRARKKGGAPLVSIGWLAVFSLLIPPVALAMIQHAANRSYDMGARSG